MIRIGRYSRFGFIFLQRSEFLVEYFRIHAVAFQVPQKLVVLQPLAPAAILLQPGKNAVKIGLKWIKHMLVMVRESIDHIVLYL